jgi:hypothetical protein
MLFKFQVMFFLKEILCFFMRLFPLAFSGLGAWFENAASCRDSRLEKFRQDAENVCPDAFGGATGYFLSAFTFILSKP